jgi:hypothetical protein
MKHERLCLGSNAGGGKLEVALWTATTWLCLGSNAGGGKLENIVLAVTQK